MPPACGQVLVDGGHDIHRLDGWSLGQDERGPILIAFAVREWQIAAIASRASHSTGPRPDRLN